MKIKPYAVPIIANNNNGRQYQQLPTIYLEPVYEEKANKINLSGFLGIVRRRAIFVITVTLGVASIVAMQTWDTPQLYLSQFRLLIEPIKAETKVEKPVSSTSDAPLDYNTQTEVLRSPSVMVPIGEQIRSKYPDINYISLMDNLKITRLGETKIIEISYQDTDRNRIKDILQQVADGYLVYGRVQRQSDVVEGIKFLENQLPGLQLKVDTLQANLQKFRQKYNFIDPGTKAQELSGRMNAIEQQQTDTITKLNEWRSFYSTVQGQLGLQPKEAMVVSALSEAPRYQKLLTELQDIESKLATESVRFTPDHPIIQDLKEQREKLLPLINEEAKRVVGTNTSANTLNAQKLTSQNSIRLSLTQQLVDATNQIKALEARYKALGEAKDLLGQEFKIMPMLTRQYADMLQELQVTNESLLRFRSNRDSLQIELAQKEDPWKVINQPETPVPINSNKYYYILMGGVAGFILGTLIALISELLDNVFHSVDELKQKTRMPILGIVPYNRSVKKIPPISKSVALLPGDNQNSAFQDSKKLYNYTASPFLEAFRYLYTNVRLLNSEIPIGSMVISSATPAEGKTVVSMNLAQAAAAMGQRVLLVDADLRCPQLHKRMNLSNMEGLTNLISSEDLDFNEVIQQSPWEENLYVMTAGKIPTDPTRLLSSGKMQHIMEKLATSFDLIIYDSPPLFSFADANILGNKTDGIVLVVGLGKTDSYPVMQVIDGLRIYGNNVLGVVANGVKKDTVRSYDYYDGYYKQTKTQKANINDKL